MNHATLSGKQEHLSREFWSHQSFFSLKNGYWNFAYGFDIDLQLQQNSMPLCCGVSYHGLAMIWCRWDNFLHEKLQIPTDHLNKWVTEFIMACFMANVVHYSRTKCLGWPLQCYEDDWNKCTFVVTYFPLLRPQYWTASAWTWYEKLIRDRRESKMASTWESLSWIPFKSCIIVFGMPERGTRGITNIVLVVSVHLMSIAHAYRACCSITAGYYRTIIMQRKFPFSFPETVEYRKSKYEPSMLAQGWVWLGLHLNRFINRQMLPIQSSKLQSVQFSQFNSRDIQVHINYMNIAVYDGNRTSLVRSIIKRNCITPCMTLSILSMGIIRQNVLRQLSEHCIIIQQHEFHCIRLRLLATTWTKMMAYYLNKGYQVLISMH